VKKVAVRISYLAVCKNFLKENTVSYTVFFSMKIVNERNIYYGTKRRRL